MSSTRAFINKVNENKVNEAFGKGDTAHVVASVTDDVRWTMVAGR